MTEGFAQRWARARGEHGPLCVGIDPHPESLTAWGLTDDVDGLRTFALTCAEVFGAEAAMVKPQSAFFERYGSRGVAVLEETLRAVAAGGALTLLDGKRGDIGSTMRGYAEAYLTGGAPLEVDALTLHPYLGYESLRPAFDVAEQHGKGVFVLALTSNPEARQIQRAHGAAGATVAGEVLAGLRADNARLPGTFGAVVGATVAPSTVAEAGGLDIGGPLLAPGYGAQGATATDLVDVFAGVEASVVPTTSRAVASAGPDRAALREAVLAARAEVVDALGA